MLEATVPMPFCQLILESAKADLILYSGMGESRMTRSFG